MEKFRTATRRLINIDKIMLSNQLMLSIIVALTFVYVYRLKFVEVDLDDLASQEKVGKKEEEVVREQFDFFSTTTESTLINIPNFTIPINRNICDVSNLGIVTILLTAPKNFRERFIIRNTWGRVDMEETNTRLVFLLGLTHEKKTQQGLEKEARQFGDIVQGGFVDSYRNLSYKTVFGLYWVSNYCKQAEFVIKTDDDMYVDLYAFYASFRPRLYSPIYKENRFIFGSVLYYKFVNRRQNSKWYTSFDDISSDMAPGGRFPPYCNGIFYVLNVGTSARLVEAARTEPFVWLEDAWVTGFLPKALKFKPTPDKTLITSNRRKLLFYKTIQNDEVYHNDFVATMVHRDAAGFNKLLNGYARRNYEKKSFNKFYRPVDKASEEHKAENAILECIFNDMKSPKRYKEKYYCGRS